MKTKIFACIQILVVVCLMLCNGGIGVNSIKKPAVFSCKEHRCGCKSESECKTHCCCELYENQNKFQGNSDEQKSSFQVFISSINCKYGNEIFAGISFTVKYIMELQVRSQKELFLCLLLDGISIPISEAVIFPPEKPPPYFA